jgi:hypothetical protein
MSTRWLDGATTNAVKITRNRADVQSSYKSARKQPITSARRALGAVDRGVSTSLRAAIMPDLSVSSDPYDYTPLPLVG